MPPSQPKTVFLIVINIPYYLVQGKKPSEGTQGIIRDLMAGLKSTECEAFFWPDQPDMACLRVDSRKQNKLEANLAELKKENIEFDGMAYVTATNTLDFARDEDDKQLEAGIYTLKMKNSVKFFVDKTQHAIRFPTVDDAITAYFIMILDELQPRFTKK